MPRMVDDSVCCALYDPMDTSTFGMKAACEILTAETGDSELIYSTSPPACYTQTPIVRFFDLNSDMKYDENDEDIEDDFERNDLDADMCCSALLADQTKDIFWDSACTTFTYSLTTLSYDDAMCQSVETTQKLYFLPAYLATQAMTADFDLTEAIENGDIDIAAEEEPVEGAAMAETDAVCCQASQDESLPALLRAELEDACEEDVEAFIG